MEESREGVTQLFLDAKATDRTDGTKGAFGIYCTDPSTDRMGPVMTTVFPSKWFNRLKFNKVVFNPCPLAVIRQNELKPGVDVTNIGILACTGTPAAPGTIALNTNLSVGIRTYATLNNAYTSLVTMIQTLLTSSSAGNLVVSVSVGQQCLVYTYTGPTSSYKLYLTMDPSSDILRILGFNESYGAPNYISLPHGVQTTSPNCPRLFPSNTAYVQCDFGGDQSNCSTSVNFQPDQAKIIGAIALGSNNFDFSTAISNMQDDWLSKPSISSDDWHILNRKLAQYTSISWSILWKETNPYRLPWTNIFHSWAKNHYQRSGPLVSLTLKNVPDDGIKVL